MPKGTKQQLHRADVYVAACAVPRFARLLLQSWRDSKFFDNIFKLVGVLIVTLHLQYNGMDLVSRSAICAPREDMYEEIRSILKLSLAGAEAYCKYYGLTGPTVVAMISGADMNFSKLRLVIALACVGKLYWQLSSHGMETHAHQELLEVFLDSKVSELERLLISWFPP